MGLLDGLRGFKFNARKAAIGSFSHYFHQRKFLYINQIQICISIKRQKNMTLIRHAFSFLSFSNLLINNLHVQ